LSVLITGGTGFLGSELARLLVERDGAHVVAFDQYPVADAFKGFESNVTVVTGDFAEPTEVAKVISDNNVDGIFHLAYLTSAAEAFPSSAVRINCLGTARLFEVAMSLQAGRVVWPSSAAVYGATTTSADPVWMSEALNPAPNSMYGACKLFNEHTAEAMTARNGFDHMALRLSSVFGAGRMGRRGIPPDFYASLIESPRQGLPLLAPPQDHIVTFAYVKDVARAFYLAMKLPDPVHRVFNLSGVSSTVAVAIEKMKARFPSARVDHSETPLRHLAYLDAERLRTELGFEVQFSLDDAIDDYLDGVAAA